MHRRNEAAIKKIEIMTITIKEFYTSTFRTDTMGLDLNPKATFLEMLNVINEGNDLYKYLGVYDSLVRERIFTEISNRLNCSYNDIYNVWLNNAKN